MDKNRGASADWVGRVVDVDCNRSAQEVRELFSQCGEIRGVYPWKSDKSPQQHYFIEFGQHSSVGNARALGKLHHHLSVHALSMVPQLIERCRAVTPRSIEDSIHAPGSRPISPGPSSLMSSRESSIGPGRRKAKNKNRIRIVNKVSQFDRNNASPQRQIPWDMPSLPASSSLLKPSENTGSSYSGCRPEDDKENDAHRANPGQSISHLPMIPFSIPHLHNLNLPPLIPGLLSAIKPQTRIVVTVCGEPITLDLESLEDDPQAIITLLKTAESGRENWMMVGGYYRMKGNADAALRVLTNMVEVMASIGVQEYDLKPAFLMLSSCQRDLGKRATSPNGQDSEESRTHFEKAIHWLQKVYGKDVPRIEIVSPAPIVSFRPSTGTSDDNEHTPRQAPVKPRSHPENPQSLPRVVQTRNLSLHAPTSMDHVSSSTSAPLTAPSVSTPSSSNTGHIRILEREIKCLRTRIDDATTALARERTLSRQLTSDLGSERALRCELERKLEDVQSKTELARRMEGFALEQVRREVEARRRAEDRAERERDARRALEEEARRKGAKPIFEDLAEVFRRAARGEGSALGALERLGGGSGSSSGGGRVKNEKMSSP